MATVTDRENIPVDDIQPKDLTYILPKLRERHDKRSRLASDNAPRKRCPQFKLKTLTKYLVVCLLFLAAVVAYVVTQTKQNSALESLAPVSPETLTGDNTGFEINVELQPQQSYQHCQGPHFKQSFPDVGYAFFGYNILRGFPLTAGHDPGFTYPIFKADYSAELLSADCRFFIPNGLVLAPDISCEISVSTTIAQTAYEYSRALQVFASLEGEYGPPLGKILKGVNGVIPTDGKKGAISSPWGVSFSASVGYRQSSTSMSSGKSVYSLSTAKCSNYFSKLSLQKPPDFDEAFLNLVYLLDRADSDPNAYFSFFDSYGTHFPAEVTFGARFTTEHKITSKYYESLRDRGLDVGLIASYARKFSVSGQLDLSVEMQKAVSEFSENVETRLVPVGASPPENGNAITWASTVKDNPLPTALKLVSIEHLFTDTFMKTLNVDYNKIHDNIVNFKFEYCLFLRNSGQVQTCDTLVPGIQLENTRLTSHYREAGLVDISDCTDSCLKDDHCLSVSFCTSCSNSDPGYQTCYMYTGASQSITALKTVEPDNIWQSYVFPEKMRTPFKLINSSILGVSRLAVKDADNAADPSKCKILCTMDAYCTAFSFYNNITQDEKCKMYSKDLTTGLQFEPGVDTYFLPARMDISSNTTTSPDK